MKKLTTLFFAMLVVAGTATAGDKVFDKAKAGYLVALESDNAGLRHNAIYQVAQLKCLFPEKDFSDVERSLKRASKKDDVAIIRVHAGLVAAYLDTNSVTCIEAQSVTEPIQFFKALYDEFNDEFIKTAGQMQITSL